MQQGVFQRLVQELAQDLYERVGLDIREAFIDGTFVPAKKGACKRAGLEDFRFHDLRHTFASHLTMGGANLRTVQTLLGHKDLRMTMRYSHLSPEHLQDAVNTLEKALSIPKTKDKVQAG